MGWFDPESANDQYAQDARRYWNKVAKRRRKTALAKHHKKVMKLVARGQKGAFPKKPPKPHNTWRNKFR